MLLLFQQVCGSLECDESSCFIEISSFRTPSPCFVCFLSFSFSLALRPPRCPSPSDQKMSFLTRAVRQVQRHAAFHTRAALRSVEHKQKGRRADGQTERRRDRRAGGRLDTATMSCRVSSSAHTLRLCVLLCCLFSADAAPKREQSGPVLNLRFVHATETIVAKPVYMVRKRKRKRKRKRQRTDVGGTGRERKQLLMRARAV